MTAADLLNDRVTLFFEEHDLRIDHMLGDRGTEFFGGNDRHDDEPPSRLRGLKVTRRHIDHT